MDKFDLVVKEFWKKEFDHQLYSVDNEDYLELKAQVTFFMLKNEFNQLLVHPIAETASHYSSKEYKRLKTTTQFKCESGHCYWGSFK